MKKHILYQAVISVADEMKLSNHETEILCSCFAADVPFEECAALLRRKQEEAELMYIRTAMKMACYSLSAAL